MNIEQLKEMTIHNGFIFRSTCDDPSLFGPFVPITIEICLPWPWDGHPVSVLGD